DWSSDVCSSDLVSVVRDLLSLAVAPDVGPLERFATEPWEDPYQVHNAGDFVPRRHQVGAVPGRHQHSLGGQLDSVHGLESPASISRRMDTPAGNDPRLVGPHGVNNLP